MSVILLDSKIIHYEALGQGRPIIFLHSWIGSWRYWLPAMQSAANIYRAYALDLWGFGDTAHEPSNYSLDNQTRLLEGFLEILGVQKAALIGHGLGAMTAIQFARKHPERMDKLMLIGLPLDIKLLTQRLRTAVSPFELIGWLSGTDPTAEAGRTDTAKTDIRAINASMSSFEETDYLAMVHTLSTPCLIVYGKNDPVVKIPDSPPKIGMTDLAREIILEDCGHFPMLDQTTRFNRLMLDFLALSPEESPRRLQIKEKWRRRMR
jgi:pimeloyl-ACP methyl ester carboxylesterase